MLCAAGKAIKIMVSLAQEVYPVAVLSDVRFTFGAIVWNRDWPGKSGRLRGEPRVGFPFDDYADADYGQRVHHVAGRTDYRTRRWEWDVTADFCRHCGGFAARCR